MGGKEGMKNYMTNEKTDHRTFLHVRNSSWDANIYILLVCFGRLLGLINTPNEALQVPPPIPS